jgi:hypothetical protein
MQVAKLLRATCGPLFLPVFTLAISAVVVLRPRQYKQALSLSFNEFQRVSQGRGTGLNALDRVRT